MNVVTAATRQLRSAPDVMGLVARVDKYKLAQDVFSTGSVVTVVSVSGSWTSDSFHSARFPRLVVMVYADPTRDRTGRKAADDQEDRALAAWNQIDQVMHVPSRRGMMWGGTTGLLVLGSSRDTEPSFVNREGEDVAMLRGTFNLKTV